MVVKFREFLLLAFWIAALGGCAHQNTRVQYQEQFSEKLFRICSAAEVSPSFATSVTEELDVLNAVEHFNLQFLRAGTIDPALKSFILYHRQRIIDAQHSRATSVWLAFCLVDFAKRHEAGNIDDAKTQEYYENLIASLTRTLNFESQKIVFPYHDDSLRDYVTDLCATFRERLLLDLKRLKADPLSPAFRAVLRPKFENRVWENINKAFDGNADDPEDDVTLWNAGNIREKLKSRVIEQYHLVLYDLFFWSICEELGHTSSFSIWNISGTSQSGYWPGLLEMTQTRRLEKE